MYLEDKGDKIYRSGPWNGVRFSGVPEMQSGEIDFTFMDSQYEVYYSFHSNDPNLLSRLTVNSSGTLERFTWVEDSKTWSRFWFVKFSLEDIIMGISLMNVSKHNSFKISLYKS